MGLARYVAAGAAGLGLFAHAIRAQTPASPAPSGAISGVVFDATTDQPVAGAIVSLGRIDMRVSIPYSVTDTKGRFLFRDLPASDQYYLGARRFGYEYTRYGWTSPNGSLATADIARVSVAADQWVQSLRIPLWRNASISGRVVDERGEPVVGVVVRTFSHANVSGQPQLVAGDLATTDDLGAYRIAGLAPGQYYVAVLSVQSTVPWTMAEAPSTSAIGQLAGSGVSAAGGGVLAMPAVDVDARHRLVITNFPTPPPPAVAQPRAYPITFHPGVGSVASASSIEIKYGDVKTAVDIQVQPVPAARVSGRLALPAGDAVPRMLLRLMPNGLERQGFGSEAATSTLEPDGTFVFLNVPSGTYTLLAQPSVMEFSSGSGSRRLPDAPGFPGGGASVGSMEGAPGLEYLGKSTPGAMWGRATVTVGARDVSDLVVPMQHAATLHGRFIFTEGMHPPSDLHLGITAEPADGDPRLGHPIGRADDNDPNHGFTISGLLGGTYLIGGGLFTSNPTIVASYRIASVTWRGREVRDTGIDASAGDDISDVVVTITDRKITVKGTVSGPNGPSGAAVIAFPVDRARWTNFGWSAMLFRTARSGSNGSYEMDRLVEGEYYLVAVDLAAIDSWTNPRFLAAAVPMASRVSLKWADVKSQDLTLVNPVIK